MLGDAFIEKCCDDKYFDWTDKDSIKVTLGEKEIVISNKELKLQGIPTITIPLAEYNELVAERDKLKAQITEYDKVIHAMSMEVGAGEYVMGNM